MQGRRWPRRTDFSRGLTGRRRRLFGHTASPPCCRPALSLPTRSACAIRAPRCGRTARWSVRSGCAESWQCPKRACDIHVGACPQGAAPGEAVAVPRNVVPDRAARRGSSVPLARPPGYDESPARPDHQASAAVMALSASRMPSPTRPAVAAQWRGMRARAPGSHRYSSGVSGSGAVLS